MDEIVDRKRPNWRITLILLLLLAAATLYTFSHGGIVNTLNLAPRLRSSTPSVQSNFELQRIQLNEYDGVWCIVKTPWLPKSGPSSDGSRVEYTPPDAFKVSASASTGSKWHVGWRIADKDETAQMPGLTPGRYVFLELPRAYPPSYHFVDIILRDKQGRSARWRLTRLQRMRHAIAPPVATNTTIEYENVTVRVTARWAYWEKYPDAPWMVEVLCSATQKPKAGTQWEVHEVGIDREWMPYGSQMTRVSDQSSSIVKVYKKTGDTGSGSGGFVNFMDTPYPQDNQHIRLVVRLLKYQSDSPGQSKLLQTIPLVFVVPVTGQWNYNPVKKRAIDDRT